MRTYVFVLFAPVAILLFQSPTAKAQDTTTIENSVPFQNIGIGVFWYRGSQRGWGWEIYVQRYPNNTNIPYFLGIQMEFAYLQDEPMAFSPSAMLGIDALIAKPFLSVGPFIQKNEDFKMKYALTVNTLISPTFSLKLFSDFQFNPTLGFRFDYPPFFSQFLTGRYNPPPPQTQ